MTEYAVLGGNPDGQLDAANKQIAANHFDRMFYRGVTPTAMTAEQNVAVNKMLASPGNALATPDVAENTLLLREGAFVPEGVDPASEDFLTNRKVDALAEPEILKTDCFQLRALEVTTLDKKRARRAFAILYKPLGNANHAHWHYFRKVLYKTKVRGEWMPVPEDWRYDWYWVVIALMNITNYKTVNLMTLDEDPDLTPDQLRGWRSEVNMRLIMDHLRFGPKFNVMRGRAQPAWRVAYNKKKDAFDATRTFVEGNNDFVSRGSWRKHARFVSRK